MLSVAPMPTTTGVSTRRRTRWAAAASARRLLCVATSISPVRRADSVGAVVLARPVNGGIAHVARYGAARCTGDVSLACSKLNPAMVPDTPTATLRQISLVKFDADSAHDRKHGARSVMRTSPSSFEHATASAHAPIRTARTITPRAVAERESAQEI